MANDLQRGDIYEIDWSPARGSEQAGFRPSLVIQNNIGNGVTRYPVTIVLAMSSSIKPYPSMVLIEPSKTNGLSVPTQVNTGQIVTIDKSRLGRYYGFVSEEDMRNINEKLSYMLGLSE